MRRRSRLTRLGLTLAAGAIGVAVLPAMGSGERAGSPFYVVPSVGAKECQNVSNCVGVTGPWVVVPAHGEATFLIRCPAPTGFSVGGTDSRASSRDVRVWFDGQLGAPIGRASSQTSTGAALLFHAVTSNSRPGSFEPFLGCVSLKQRSPRSTVSALPGTPPGAPLDLRATIVTLEPGVLFYQTARVTCLPGETVAGTWNALAFVTGPPELSTTRLVSIRSVVTRHGVVAILRASRQTSLWPIGAFPEVQLGVKCEE